MESCLSATPLLCLVDLQSRAKSFFWSPPGPPKTWLAWSVCRSPVPCLLPLTPLMGWHQSFPGFHVLLLALPLLLVFISPTSGHCKGKRNSDPINYATHRQAGWADCSPLARPPHLSPIHSPGSPDPRSLTLTDITWAPSLWTSCWLQPMEGTRRLEGGKGEVGTFLFLHALCSGLMFRQWLLPSMTLAPVRPSY